jgi:hypothetical protein
MTPEEIAPPFESWEAHLKDLPERDLLVMANEYRWLDTEVQAEEEGEEFHRRREAIIAECRRRGLSRPAPKS